MARKFPDIADQFKPAVATFAQQKEIDALRVEVEQLRAKQSPELEVELTRLREQLSSQTGEIEVDTNLIDPNPSQPRRTITDAEIQKKVRFLSQQGQTVPIILIPQNNGRYLIFDGEVRWRAARFKLGWGKIKAVLIPMPEDLHRSALETFLGFEDLNPLDKAEAVFHQVKQETGVNPDRAFTLLNTCLRALERSGQVRELGKLVNDSSELQAARLQSLGVTEEATLQLLLSILQMGLNPASVKTQLLPMLSLPEDLKVAVREKGLKGAHALILATLSAKALKSNEETAAKERIKATQTVLLQDLTVAKTRELVAKIKAKFNPTPAPASRKVASLLKTLDVVIAGQDLQLASAEQLTELRQKLTAALEAIGKK